MARCLLFFDDSIGAMEYFVGTMRALLGRFGCYYCY